MVRKINPGEARQNGRGDWVDEHGNPMPAPGARGGREGYGELVEDPVTGKLVPKQPKDAAAPAETDRPPAREDFPPGVMGSIAHQKAVKEWEAKRGAKKTSSLPDLGDDGGIAGALLRTWSRRA
jgi:hypothetical protein